MKGGTKVAMTLARGCMMEEVEDGWITGINFAEFVEREWEKYHIDYYINFGGNLHLPQWRTLKPELIFLSINHIISHRLGTV